MLYCLFACCVAAIGLTSEPTPKISVLSSPAELRAWSEKSHQTAPSVDFTTQRVVIAPARIVAVGGVGEETVVFLADGAKPSFRVLPTEACKKLVAAKEMADDEQEEREGEWESGERHESEAEKRPSFSSTGPFSMIRTEKYVVIRDQQTLLDVWQQHCMSSAGCPAPPNIDFRKESYIAYFAGDLPAGGYYVNLEPFVAGDGVVYAMARITTPRGEIYPAIHSQPYSFIKVPAKVKGIRLVRPRDLME